MKSKQKHIALFLYSMGGGGAERVMLNLAIEFAKLKYKVDLVLVTKKGPYLKQVPKNVRIVSFFIPSRKFRTLFSVIPLLFYLRKEKPDTLIAASISCNVIAVMAKILSRSQVKIVIGVHNTFSIDRQKLGFLKRLIMSRLVYSLYPRADAIIAVSKGVADDLSRAINIPRQKIKVIYNPIVNSEVYRKVKEEEIDHSYFSDSSLKVIIGVGRLTEQKDFPTLIKAFAKVRQKINSKLIILGEGKDRKKLEKLIQNLNLEKDVSLPGFVDNPYAYMARSDVFVLSSRWEGLPTVLVEAMACGAPVVSTNCKSGPAEILENGKYGKLVPVGDVDALAEAIWKTLKNPLSSDILRERAKNFSVEKAVSEYLKVINGKD